MLECVVTEGYIIDPMARYFQLQDDHHNADSNNDDNDMEGDDIGKSMTCTEDNNKAVKWIEKLICIHQPSHPTSWWSYIHYVVGKSGTTTMITITTTRGDDSNGGL